MIMESIIFQSVTDYLGRVILIRRWLLFANIYKVLLVYKNSLATAKDISNELDNIEKYVNEIKVAVPDDEELQILVNECLGNIENTRSLDNSEVK